VQGRRLAGAGLADQAEGLAPADVEVDTVDGEDLADLAAEDGALDERGCTSSASCRVQPVCRRRIGQTQCTHLSETKMQSVALSAVNENSGIQSRDGAQRVAQSE